MKNLPCRPRVSRPPSSLAYSLPSLRRRHGRQPGLDHRSPEVGESTLFGSDKRRVAERQKRVRGNAGSSTVRFRIKIDFIVHQRGKLSWIFSCFLATVRYKQHKPQIAARQQHRKTFPCKFKETKRNFMSGHTSGYFTSFQRTGLKLSAIIKWLAH